MHALGEDIVVILHRVHVEVIALTDSLDALQDAVVFRWQALDAQYALAVFADVRIERLG